MKGSRVENEQKNKLDILFWITAAVLLLFWIIVSNSIHYQSLLIGIACSLGVALFNRELLLRRGERPVFSWKVPVWGAAYLGNLIISIVLANIQVAKIVLQPRMPITPGFVLFTVQAKTDLGQVVMANSVTLTPGTLTIQVREGEYLVHALTREHAEKVSSGDMENKLLFMETAGESR